MASRDEGDATCDAKRRVARPNDTNINVASRRGDPHPAADRESEIKIRVEFVIVAGDALLKKQAAAVRQALRWFASHSTRTGRTKR